MGVKVFDLSGVVLHDTQLLSIPVGANHLRCCQMTSLYSTGKYFAPTSRFAIRFRPPNHAARCERYQADTTTLQPYTAGTSWAASPWYILALRLKTLPTPRIAHPE